MSLPIIMIFGQAKAFARTFAVLFIPRCHFKGFLRLLIDRSGLVRLARICASFLVDPGSFLFACLPVSVLSLSVNDTIDATELVLFISSLYKCCFMYVPSLRYRLDCLQNYFATNLTGMRSYLLPPHQELSLNISRISSKYEACHLYKL